MDYKTPGVYVEEISKFPPSIAQSETAIPVFIGSTEIIVDSKGKDLINVAIEIRSMMDYENIFGGPVAQEIELKLNPNAPYAIQEVMNFAPSNYSMHSSLRLFFANGGGECFIVSTGDYSQAITYSKLEKGLKSIEKNEDITLIVFPEASGLANNDMYSLYQDALAHCNGRTNRFTILDTKEDMSTIPDFRTGLGSSFLDKGAAYFPHLNTNIPYNFTSDKVKFKDSPLDGFSLKQVQVISDFMKIKQEFDRLKSDVNNLADDDSLLLDLRRDIVKKGMKDTQKALKKIESTKDLIDRNGYAVASSLFKIDETIVKLEKLDNPNSLSATAIDSALTKVNAVIDSIGTNFDKVLAKLNTETSIDATKNDEILEVLSSQFISELNKLLDSKYLTLPPSPALAGIYARTDGNRGVWKSPANVSLNRVIGPAVKISAAENDDLNVHSTGKSINAIRSFTGKGTLVWGARTLDGNSNEWKYISVRRFFSMVEESAKRASANFIFEPNNANTWVKVKAMIENFLVVQWRNGALMGSKSEDAFFVKVGLGITMDEDQVNNGIMIIEIGLAAVRPAEFIILRFSHKMLES